MKDGLRQRLHLMTLPQPLRLILNRDAFSQASPVRVNSHGTEIAFRLDSRWLEPHTTELTLSGLAQGTYELKVNGRAERRVQHQSSERIILDIPVDGTLAPTVEIRREPS
jgi:hypothetical protein